jgi:hypothetical protein
MKRKNYSEDSAIKEFCEKVFGGAKLWSQIVKEAEKDVASDKKNKDTENFEGLDNIIKLINDNITGPDNMKITEEEAKKLKEQYKKPYKILKKELDDVRVLRVGKTAPEKTLAVAKSIGRFVGEIVASSVHIVGKSVETVGKLIHYTPAAYVLNRAPFVSKKSRTGERTNFLEIIGNAINQGAQEVSLEFGKMPIFAKVAIKTSREEKKTKISPVDTYELLPKFSSIEEQLKVATEAQERLLASIQDQVTIEKISSALPNLRKGKSNSLKR